MKLARMKSGQKSRGMMLRFVIPLLAVLLSMAGCGQSASPAATAGGATERSAAEIVFDGAATLETAAGKPSAASNSGRELLTVSYIDVGQADSILVQGPAGQAVLIDGGNHDDGATVLKYIRSKGITTLDAVIATHPHEDHIGGLAAIIQGLTVQAVYLPRTTTTTAAFKAFIEAINASGATRIQAKSGVTLDVAGLSGTFLAPVGTEYANLNDFSAVLRLTYGDTVFLFTGDAEALSEKEIVEAGSDLNADVLKIGHHGSDSSTTDSFLKAVSPSIAVISVGKGNSYGHPAPTTLDKLTASGVTVYRTDEDGTVVIQSDGKSLTVNGVAISAQPNAPPGAPDTEKSAAPSTAPTAEPPVVAQPETPGDGVGVDIYITKTGEKYHVAGCESLAKSKIAITLADAKRKGYTPCRICNPPQ